MAHVIKAHVHIHHHIQHLSVFGRLHKQASQIAVQRVEHRSDRIHNYEQSVPFKRMQSHAAEHEHNAVVRHDVGPVQSNQCRRVPAYRRQQSILFGTAASGFALGCTAVLAHAEYWLLQSARVRVRVAPDRCRVGWVRYFATNCQPSSCSAAYFRAAISHTHIVV